MATPIPVSTTGVGRPDYSLEINRSVSPTTIKQFQIPSSLSVLLPTLPYPYMYFIVEGFRTPDFSIPANRRAIGYNLVVSGDTNATSAVSIQIYDTYDNVTDTLGDLYDTISMKLARKTVELHTTKGYELQNYAGKYLVILFSHWSANPFSFMNLNLHGLVSL